MGSEMCIRDRGKTAKLNASKQRRCIVVEAKSKLKEATQSRKERKFHLRGF